MRALVVYESMYGNTHRIAEAIGAGLGRHGVAEVRSIHDVGADLPVDLDLLVVGGPTHVHGMTRPSTRREAVERGDGRHVELDADAAGEGVREWLADLRPAETPRPRVAAFDTRMDGPALLTGRASKGIAKELRHHDFVLLADPESFLVTKEDDLEPGEADHACAWGERLGAALA